MIKHEIKRDSRVTFPQERGYPKYDENGESNKPDRELRHKEYKPYYRMVKNTNTKGRNHSNFSRLRKVV